MSVYVFLKEREELSFEGALLRRVSLILLLAVFIMMASGPLTASLILALAGIFLPAFVLQDFYEERWMLVFYHCALSFICLFLSVFVGIIFFEDYVVVQELFYLSGAGFVFCLIFLHLANPKGLSTKLKEV